MPHSQDDFQPRHHIGVVVLVDGLLWLDAVHYAVQHLKKDKFRLLGIHPYIYVYICVCAHVYDMYIYIYYIQYIYIFIYSIFNIFNLFMYAIGQVSELRVGFTMFYSGRFSACVRGRISCSTSESSWALGRKFGARRKNWEL